MVAGKTVTVPDLRTVPLVFQAGVIPASQTHINPVTAAPDPPPKKGTIS